jgi:hypothetical protein
MEVKMSGPATINWTIDDLQKAWHPQFLQPVRNLAKRLGVTVTDTSFGLRFTGTAEANHKIFRALFAICYNIDIDRPEGDDYHKFEVRRSWTVK